MFDKLYKGERAIAIGYFRERGPRLRKLLKWALTVKVGDYIGTCEGCNRQVEEIEPIFIDVMEFQDSDEEEGTETGTQILYEVMFTDTNGRFHYCPGGGCAYPKESPEQVTNYFKSVTLRPEREQELRHWFGKNNKDLQKALDRLGKFRAAFAADKPIVDKDGELLKEFDNVGGKND